MSVFYCFLHEKAEMAASGNQSTRKDHEWQRLLEIVNRSSSFVLIESNSIRVAVYDEKSEGGEREKERREEQMKYLKGQRATRVEEAKVNKYIRLHL
jgi:hypothetical protein